MPQRPPNPDVFRPRLPLDPFAALTRGPWRPSIPQDAQPPSAVLILGEPLPEDLQHLLGSLSLAKTLLVLTHAPPYIPQTPTPTLRILRLSAPLALHDVGALRLVSLLERADRVVRRFRASEAEQNRRLVQLAENPTTGEFDLEEAYSLPSPPPSPTSRLNHDHGDDPQRYPSPAPSVSSSMSSSSSTHSTPSSPSSSSSSLSSPRRRHNNRHKQADSSRPPTDRMFDAIVNFLPGALPDKILLKYTILLSTLAASFFAAPPAPLLSTTSPPPSSSNKLKKRLSVFSTLSFSTSDAHLTGQDDEQLRTTKNNPRRFSALLRPQHYEVVHSAPCSRDSLPLDPNHIKGKYRSQQPTSSRRKTHLIHVLPPHVYPISMGANAPSSRRKQPKPKLVQSIEQFLLALGYPLQSMSLLPSPSASTPASRRISSASTISAFMTSASTSPDGVGQKPVPFLLPAGVFGSVPSGGNVMSIGEILVMGGLDGNDGIDGEIDGFDAGQEGRVWIASAGDVVWEDSSSLGSTRNVVDLTHDDPRESTSMRHFSLGVPSLSAPSTWRSTSSPLILSSPPSEVEPHSSSGREDAHSPPSPPRSPTAISSSHSYTAPSTQTRPTEPSSDAFVRDDKKLQKARRSTESEKEKVNTGLPTPPESTSSLEDEPTDTAPSSAPVSTSVSASPSVDEEHISSSHATADTRSMGDHGLDSREQTPVAKSKTMKAEEKKDMGKGKDKGLSLKRLGRMPISAFRASFRGFSKRTASSTIAEKA